MHPSSTTSSKLCPCKAPRLVYQGGLFWNSGLEIDFPRFQSSKCPVDDLLTALTDLLLDLLNSPRCFPSLWKTYFSPPAVLFHRVHNSGWVVGANPTWHIDQANVRDELRWNSVTAGTFGHLPTFVYGNIEAMAKYQYQRFPPHTGRIVAPSGMRSGITAGQPSETPNKDATNSNMTLSELCSYAYRFKHNLALDLSLSQSDLEAPCPVDISQSLNISHCLSFLMTGLTLFFSGRLRHYLVPRILG